MSPSRRSLLPSILDGWRPELGPRATRVYGWTRDVFTRLDRARTFGIAAETAFWLLLSLVPLAAVLGLVAARVTAGHWRDTAPLLSSLPLAARQLVSTELVKLAAWNDGAVDAGSAAVFLWLASTGVHSLFDSLELQAGTSRRWWRKRLYALGACVVLSVAVAVVALHGLGVRIAMEWLEPRASWLRGEGLRSTLTVLRFTVSALIVLGYTCALYRLGVPRERGLRAPILPGALIAVALELALGFVYAMYIVEAGDSGAYLAGLAVIGVTMMGLYLFVVSLLVGAAVNRKLAEDRATPLDDARPQVEPVVPPRNPRAASK